MKLVEARIQNFKSIEDSEPFTLGQLTCLAGKNESGKTAILQALYHLNPVEPTLEPLNKVMEYPRHRLDQFDVDSKEFLTTTWELGDADRSEVEKVLGEGCFASNEVVLTKTYEKPDADWKVNLNHQAILSRLADQFELTDPARARLAKRATTTEAVTAIAGAADSTTGERNLREHIQSWEGGSATAVAISILRPLLPKLLYFSRYEQMEGQVAINQLLPKMADETKLTTPDKVFLALLDLAKTSVDEIRNVRLSEELIARLEGVSNGLTRQIFKYWSQNRHLRVQFRYEEAETGDTPPFNEGRIFRTRIWNDRHGVSVTFDERSAGFIWFFSFLVWFSQMRKTFGENLLVLLDEPGLSLHGRAQADLLRYFHEELLPQFQVVYTTHSPFMIDSSDILSVRTVEDVVLKDEKTDEEIVLGTKVGDKSLSTDSDTLFPLRAALGYDLTQSLFVGEHTLLVEGPSDFLFLKWASVELEKRKRTPLDRRWTITPAGGIDKLASFVALFGGNNLHVAVLADYHHGDKAKVRNLRESELLRGGHVFSAEVYSGGEEADVEDMLGRQFYVALVNACYSLTGRHSVPDEKPESSSLRVEQEVADFFMTLPASVPEFDHFQPAAFLMEHAAEFSAQGGIDTALDRFEAFFKDVNSLV